MSTKYPFLLSREKITIYVDGRPSTIQCDDLRFDDIVTAAEAGDNAETKRLVAAASKAATLAAKVGGEESEFVFNEEDGSVTFKGFVLEGSLARQLEFLLEQGEDLGRWRKFVDRLIENPSDASVRELFDFLNYKELAIDQDGMIIAYKGVQDDYYSAHGNTKTKVKQGTVNDLGQIYNGIGETIEVYRNQVDDDRRRHCSNGLHVGSWDYASSWSNRTILVRVDPADVVSVPEDCSCQKMRVTRYEVLEDVERELSVSAVDTSSEVKITEQVSAKDEIDKKIKAYIESRFENGVEPTLKQIQSRLKEHPLGVVTILQRVEALGFDVERNSDALSRSIVVNLCGDCCLDDEYDDDWDDFDL